MFMRFVNGDEKKKSLFIITTIFTYKVPTFISMIYKYIKYELGTYVYIYKIISNGAVFLHNYIFINSFVSTV